VQFLAAAREDDVLLAELNLLGGIANTLTKPSPIIDFT